jgi:TolA-binding protein
MLKPKKGITKKEIKEDKLVTSYFKTRGWIEQNRRLVSYIISVPIILVAILWFVENNRRQSNERATTDLAKVYHLYDQGQYQLAVDGIPQENIRGLQSIVDDYGSTQAGEMAKLYLANSYFSMTNYDKALKYFQSVDISDKLLSSSALAGEASCYEAKGNHEEAANLYEQAASKYMTALQAPDDLFKAANNYSIAGKKDKAAEMLHRLKKEFPTSTYARDLDRYLAEFGDLKG